MTLWTLFDDMLKQPLQGRFIGLGDEELNAATTRGVGTGQSDTVGACASSLRHPHTVSDLSLARPRWRRASAASGRPFGRGSRLDFTRYLDAAPGLRP